MAQCGDSFCIIKTMIGHCPLFNKTCGELMGRKVSHEDKAQVPADKVHLIPKCPSFNKLAAGPLMEVLKTKASSALSACFMG